MKITDEMNFPQPVLAEWRDDYTSGEFIVDIAYAENIANNQLTLSTDTKINCSEIQSLLKEGTAQIGIFVSCRSTGYRRLVEIQQHEFKHEFKAGALLDTVLFRPVVWVNSPIKNWAPAHLHDEYIGGSDLVRGDIIALAHESSIAVSQAKLPSIETIFELKIDDSLEGGEISIDMGGHKICILANRATYQLIETLRASGRDAAVVMNSLYVPAVMEVLVRIATDNGDANYAEFDGNRWVAAFEQRCISLDIDHRQDSAFRNSQKLLQYPFEKLSSVEETCNGA